MSEQIGIRDSRSRRSRLEAFNKAADDISMEWVRRLAQDTSIKHELPHAWLKRETYALLKSIIEAGNIDITYANFRNDRRSGKMVEKSLMNPFKAGLLAIFSDDSILSRKNRHVYGNQMLYSWIHDVPPEFLNGFLAVTGGAEAISQKLKDGFIEPGFEKRYLASRLPAHVLEEPPVSNRGHLGGLRISDI